MSKTKKILIVGKNPPPHFGTSVWFQTLQNNYWPDHQELHYFDNNTHSSIHSIEKWSFKRMWLTLKLINSFSRNLKTIKPDLIVIPISQSRIGFLKDSFFIRRAKKRSLTLIVLHGSNWLNWFKGSSKNTQAMVKRNLKDTSGAIVLGENLKFIFEDFYADNQIFSVPNGVADAYAGSLKKTNTLPVITYLGNLQAGKGIRELITAFTLLKNQEYVLQLIGSWRDAETEKYCLNLIEKHGLPVQVLGPRFGQEKMEILAQSDIFVFAPVQAEGHPLVILEAMSCALPIISTNRGAIAETIIDGEQGFVLDNPDPEKLAKALSELISNPEKRLAFGKAARERFLQHYTDKAMIQRYSSVFDQVFNG